MTTCVYTSSIEREVRERSIVQKKWAVTSTHARSPGEYRRNHAAAEEEEGKLISSQSWTTQEKKRSEDLFIHLWNRIFAVMMWKQITFTFHCYTRTNVSFQTKWLSYTWLDVTFISIDVKNFSISMGKRHRYRCVNITYIGFFFFFYRANFIQIEIELLIYLSN